MKKAYPVFMKDVGDGVFAVSIPDFKNFTEGYGLADAIDMARDAIGSLAMYLEDEGCSIPEPFSVKAEPEDGEFQTFVDIDFDAYRAMNSTKLVKKNCTIPYYLEYAAEKAGLNFSRVLTEALASKLNLSVD